MGVSAITCMCGTEIPLTGDEPPISCPNCSRTFSSGDLEGLGIGASSKPRSPQEIGAEGEWDTKEFYESMGCKVYKLSQPGKVRASRGVPDLLIFRRGCTQAPAPVWCHEVKSGENPRQTEHQQRFQEVAEEAGLDYVLGDVKAAAEYLGFTVEE